VGTSGRLAPADNSGRHQFAAVLGCTPPVFPMTRPQRSAFDSSRLEAPKAIRAQQQRCRSTCVTLLINFHAVLGCRRSCRAVARLSRLARAEQGVPTAGEIHLLAETTCRRSGMSHTCLQPHALCRPLVRL